MFPTRLPPFLATAALAVPLLLHSPGGETTLAFAPAAGSMRSLEASLQHFVSGGELAVVMNGEPVPGTFLPELRIDYDDERSFSVEEVFLAGGAGGPSEWLRHYTSIRHLNEGSFGMTMPGQEPVEMPWESDAESELEGAVLRIRAQEGELEPQVVEGRAPPEDLRLDLSFAALLPAQPVALGESWRVEDEALAFLLEPGGDLGVILSEETRRNLFPEYDTREHSGALTLTLRSVDEGRARIEIEGELVRTSVGPGDLSQVPVTDGTATDTTTEVYEASGELIWDTAAGALAELSLGGRYDTETITERDPDLPGPTYESSFSAAGEWSLEVTSSAVESSVLEAAAAR